MAATASGTATSDAHASTEELPLTTSVNDEERGDENKAPTDDKTPTKYRQWLVDRMFGKSPPPESKPPCWVCYVPPCISIAPDVLEQNSCCECYGKIGIVDSELPGTWRRRLLAVSALFNVVSIFLTITACFSISTNYNILQAIPFSSGIVRVTNVDTNRLIDTVTTDVGLQAVAYEYSSLNASGVIMFDEFCNYNQTSWEARFIRPSDCTSCAEASDSLIFTLAVSAFPYIPSLITDIIRMYANYDINCLKMFATLASGAGMALSMYSFLAYRFQCFFTFYTGEVYYTIDGTEVETPEEADIVTIVEWNPGNGLICIIVATAFMGIGIIVNLLVPTPKITRDHALQEEYENIYGFSSGVPVTVSWSGFISAFCNMICGKKTNDEENALPSEGMKDESDGNIVEGSMDRGESRGVEKE